MSVQTNYGIEHADRYLGMVADSQLINTVSRLNKGAVNIAFGKGVVTDGENGAKLPTSASVLKSFNGVAMRELNRAYMDEETFGAAAGFDFSVITDGVVFVKTLADVTIDDAVFLRVGATDAGDFAKAAGSGVTLSIAITGAKFLETKSAGEIVKISLGLGG
jgi:hypothetical protein